MIPIRYFWDCPIFLTLKYIRFHRKPSNDEEYETTTSNYENFIAGWEAKEKEIPWQVILEDMNCGTLCGGTIINLRYILTAAHCIDSFKQKSDDFYGKLPYPANILGKYYCSINIF